MNCIIFRKLVVALSFVAASAMVVAAKPKDLVLAQDNMARAVIVVPDELDHGMKFASKELADYLNKMTQGRFMVNDEKVSGLATIRLKYDDLGNDEAFSIKVGKKELTIIGGGQRGLVYGVYDLLEYLGCGFWSMDNETVPKCDTLTIPVGYEKSDAPKISIRASDTPFGSFEYHLKIRANWSRISNSVEAELEKFGGSKSLDIMHSMTRWSCIPHSVYFDKHPDWFGLMKVKNPIYWPYIKKCGKYNWDSYVPEKLRGEWVRSKAVICTTNPEMRQELLKRIDNYLSKNYPRIKTFSLSPEDTLEVCECDNCSAVVESDTAKTPSVLYINLCNFVADHFKDKYPEMTFNLLSYGSTLWPPNDTERFKMRPNTGVAVAMLWRNHGLPVNCAERFYSRFEKWSKICNNFYYWDYYTCFTAYMNPFPNRLILSDAYRFYYDNGFKGGFAQMSRNRFTPFVDMLWWVKGRIAWDPYADVNALTDFYIKGAYGAAAPQVRRMLEIMEHARNRERSLWMGCYVSDTTPLLTVDDIMEIYKLSRSIENILSKDPNSGRRLAGWRFGCIGDYLYAVRYPDIDATIKSRKLRKIEPWRNYISRVHSRINDWRNSKEMMGEVCLLSENGLKSIWTLLENVYTEEFEQLKIVPNQPNSFSISADKLNPKAKSTTLEKDSDGTLVSKLNFKWGADEPKYMTPDYSETGFNVTNEMVGTWYVFADVRAGATVSNDEATAYCGIYSPWYIGNRIVKSGIMEIASRRIERLPEDTGFRLESLGKWRLTPNTRIWVMPGIMHPTTNVAVRGFHLLKPALLEKNYYSPSVSKTAKWPVVKRDQIDRYDYWVLSPDEGTNTISKGKYIQRYFGRAEGKKHIFARVIVKSNAWFDNHAARIEYVRKGQVIASRHITSQKGDNAWQLVSLGEVDVLAGDIVRVVPDSSYVTEISLRSFYLVDPKYFAY